MAAAQTMKYMITRHSTIRSVPLKSSFRLKLLPMIGISQLRNNDDTNNAGRPEAPVEDKGKAFKKQASDKYLIYALPYEQSSLSSQQARETSLSCQADEGRLGLLATQPIQLSRLKKQLNKRGILSCYRKRPVAS